MQVSRALITGASSGIGEEFARQLASRGVNLVLVARRRERLDALAAELDQRHRRRVEVLTADLTDTDDLARVQARLTDAEARVDLLVNNAGFGLYGEFPELDAERLREMVELNVTALMCLTRTVVPELVERGGGGVINVASTAAFQPDPYGAVYGASKAFVRSFTEAIHTELAGTGVRAMVLCPGFTATEFQQIAGVVDNAMPSPGVMSADAVVTTALRDFARGRATCVPGLVNRLTAASADATPSALPRFVSGRLHRHFTGR